MKIWNNSLSNKNYLNFDKVREREIKERHSNKTFRTKTRNRESGRKIMKRRLQEHAD